MAQRTAMMTSTHEVYIGNLAATVNEAMLRAAFAPCGSIHTVVVMYDRVSAASKGYGFVYFNSKEAQQLACLPPFNYQILEGYQVMVLPMDRDTTLFINGLDQSMSEEECKLEVQALCGPLLHFELKMDPQFQSKGFGFATFQTESMMRSAMTKLSKNRIRNRRLKVDIARPLGTEEISESGANGSGSSNNPSHDTLSSQTEIFISNLSLSIDSDFLENYFCQWGEVSRALVVLDDRQRSKGYGFVNFQHKEDTEMAILNGNNQVLCGQPIHVTLAKLDSEKRRGDSGGSDSRGSDSSRGRGRGGSFEGRGDGRGGGRGRGGGGRGWSDGGGPWRREGRGGYQDHPYQRNEQSQYSNQSQYGYGQDYSQQLQGRYDPTGAHEQGGHGLNVFGGY